ncbi:hypothetical protein Enr8_42230 [Blastopirellula retiformator]|uniref:Uncharacterized protein n=1 Tax=Blastopirellula retiformator TaxID=2527970 RepID=A0A5C5UYG9_9BACT|nr:hypothetical protein Enr8_42230 [Blastopirellula retiformator]
MLTTLAIVTGFVTLAVASLTRWVWLLHRENTQLIQVVRQQRHSIMRLETEREWKSKEI